MQTRLNQGRSVGVSLNDIAIQVLNEQQGKHEIFVFTNSQGKPMKNWQWKTWHRITEKANIYDVRFHDLRHTWASWLIQRGTPLAALQENETYFLQSKKSFVNAMSKRIAKQLS